MGKKLGSPTKSVTEAMQDWPPQPQSAEQKMVAVRIAKDQMRSLPEPQESRDE